MVYFLSLSYKNFFGCYFENSWKSAVKLEKKHNWALYSTVTFTLLTHLFSCNNQTIRQRKRFWLMWIESTPKIYLFSTGQWFQGVREAIEVCLNVQTSVPISRSKVRSAAQLLDVFQCTFWNLHSTAMNKILTDCENRFHPEILLKCSLCC